VQLPSGTDQAVLDVLRSGLLAQGEQVAAFEQEFAALHGVAHAVAVCNGTTALVAALTALGIGPGDEVITTPFSFVATVNAVLAVGARPRFADIRVDDFGLDPAAVEAAITPATAAILVVHLFGQCADMGALGDIATRHGLALVEDAAQAHGASFAGRHAGTFGVGCFSFYGTKNLTTGEGGMVTVPDLASAERLRRLRNHGMVARYEYTAMGHNWRMTEMAAAIGRVQLPGYEAVVARRSRNAARLTTGLAGLDQVVTPVELPGRRHVWHQYTVRLTGAKRDEVVGRLATHGVGSAVHYPQVLCDLAHVDAGTGRAPEVPTARAMASSVLSVPVHHHLTDAEVERVVWASRDALRPSRR
jgi:dTDP-4-amino-4,6-dideoxygalactose transaminase